MMHIFILLFTVSAISYSAATPPQMPEEVDKAVDDCIASSGVDPKIPEKAFLKGEFVDDKNFKCFLKCVFIKMGDMTETGELSADNMKARAPPGLSKEKIGKVVDDCAKPQGSEPCEIAYNAAKCMVEQSIKVFST